VTDTKKKAVVAPDVATDLSDHGTVTLKAKRDWPLRRRHPWVFSGAIDRVVGENGVDPGSGDVVVVKAADGTVLGRGAYSPTSQLRVRMWSFDDAPLSEATVVDRLNGAAALRDELVFTDVAGDATDGARLVFAESDGLPGLVIDSYGDVAVMQCQSAGAERIKPLVVRWLTAVRKARVVVDRGDADVRKKEGLPLHKTVLVGALSATAPTTTTEHGLHFRVDVEQGHKTGFYLDQRDSRHTLRRLSAGKRVLNCFCYTGGFSVAALAGGASHVTSVDTSMAALELGQENARDNGFPDERHDWLKGDCFDVLKGLHADGERFDIVVLDPPKFAPSAAHLESALRGYRDLAIRGLRVLKPGGLLLTFSCSGAVSREAFRSVLHDASLDVGRAVHVVGELGHSRCHPVAVSFPEGEYLKGMLARVG
jgi:23S rRNA (cytosine1962-C5)-methyltransferase